MKITLYAVVETETGIAMAAGPPFEASRPPGGLWSPFSAQVAKDAAQRTLAEALAGFARGNKFELDGQKVYIKDANGLADLVNSIERKQI